MRCVPPAAGRDVGGAAVGADGDVPRERPFGSRSHLRPVADGSAEDVQVKGPAGREPPPGAGPAGWRLPLRLWPPVAGSGGAAVFVSGRWGGRGWKRGKVFVRGTGRNPGRSLAPVGSG